MPRIRRRKINQSKTVVWVKRVCRRGCHRANTLHKAIKIKEDGERMKGKVWAECTGCGNTLWTLYRAVEWGDKSLYYGKDNTICINTFIWE